MTTLALITARGGSKGIPGKNIAELGGRPLIAWTVEAALGCPELDRVVLSSDDTTIQAAARDAGCEVPFTRPAELSGDSAGSVDVALHALDSLGDGFDRLVLLQPTSPFRSSADISATLARAKSAQSWSAVTVEKLDRSPWHSFTLAEDGRLVPLMDETRALPRQALPTIYSLNGAVYVVDVARFRERRRFVDHDSVAQIMPRHRSIDIDEPYDLALARAMLAAGLPFLEDP